MSAIDQCNTVLTIPQVASTCWFNALLMTMFYSEGMRSYLKTNLKNSELFRKNKKLYDIFQDILVNRYRIRKDEDRLYFEKLSPEAILTMLNKFDNKIFYFDPTVANGHYGEFYFVRLFEYFGLKQNVLYLNHTEEGEYYYSTLNKTPKITMTKYGLPQIGFQPVMKEDVSVNRNVDVLVVSNILDKLSNKNNLVFKSPKKSDIDEFLEYNGHTYKLDGMILTNFNASVCRKAHQIAGVTCENKRFLYNGWVRRTRDPAQGASYTSRDVPCELMRYDWMKNRSIFCLDQRKCGVQNKSKVLKTKLCFNPFESKVSTFIYVKIGGESGNVSQIKKPCPPDKVLNPVSGRCVSKTGAIGKKLTMKAKKTCPPGKVLNPVSGRCVSKKQEKKKPCPPDKILNPASGRCVSKTGALGKKLRS